MSKKKSKPVGKIRLSVPAPKVIQDEKKEARRKICREQEKDNCE